MNANNIKIYRIALIVAVILAAVSATLISLSFGCYDETIQHFASGAALPVIAFAVAALAAAPGIAAAVIARFSPDARLKLHESKKTTASMLYPRFTIAAGFFAYAIYVFMASAGENKPATLTIIAAVFAFCSALYFITRAFAPKNMVVTAAMSLFPIGWAIFSILDVYFTKALALNSPVKSMMLVAYIYMIIFFISEARFANRKQTVPFFVFASLAASAALSVIAPLLYLSAKKVFSGAAPIPAMPLMSALLLAIIAVFALIRAVDTYKGHLRAHDPIKELENIEEEAALAAAEAQAEAEAEAKRNGGNDSK